jgi:aldehyde:ferredoxin oxidoreductase
MSGKAVFVESEGKGFDFTCDEGSKFTQWPPFTMFWASKKLDPASIEKKPPMDQDIQDLTVAIDSSGLCPFVIFGSGASEVASQLSAATRIDFTPEKIVECGERVWNLE